MSDFISLSIHTGLRISDIVTFHISRLNLSTGEVKVRTTKTGTPVSVWIPNWLQAVIRRRSLQVGPLIFGKHETTDLTVITDLWRRKLKRVWKLTGHTWPTPPTPHRFRHTFVRILLEAGVSVANVAELIGDTEQMVRKHYSAWIPSRQAELTADLQKAFATKPRPAANVIEMKPKTGTK